MWRKRTHWTMMLAGGISLIIIYLLSGLRIINSITIKSILCSLIITFLELIIGSITNLKYKLNIWDYSGCKYNYKGQICLKYSIYWSILSFISIKIINLFWVKISVNILCALFVYTVNIHNFIKTSFFYFLYAFKLFHKYFCSFFADICNITKLWIKRRFIS